MKEDKITIRAATVVDASTILHQRRSMFRDMGEGTADELDRMAAMTEPWLAQALSDDSYRGWLAEDGSGRVLGGGGVLLCPWPASPKDPGLRRAIIIERLHRTGVSSTGDCAAHHVDDSGVAQGAGLPVGFFACQR